MSGERLLEGKERAVIRITGKLRWNRIKNRPVMKIRSYSDGEKKIKKGRKESAVGEVMRRMKQRRGTQIKLWRKTGERNEIRMTSR